MYQNVSYRCILQKYLSLDMLIEFVLSFLAHSLTNISNIFIQYFRIFKMIDDFIIQFNHVLYPIFCINNKNKNRYKYKIYNRIEYIIDINIK